MDTDASMPAWISHAAAALLGAIPGVGAWYLELKKSKQVDENTAFDEMQAVVARLREEIDRMKAEIRELRQEGAERSSRLVALSAQADDAAKLSRLYRDELHELKNWIQANNWPMPASRRPQQEQG
jgi:uncharacterized small protein (DUF1192 family)